MIVCCFRILLVPTVTAKKRNIQIQVGEFCLNLSGKRCETRKDRRASVTVNHFGSRTGPALLAVCVMLTMSWSFDLLEACSNAKYPPKSKRSVVNLWFHNGYNPFIMENDGFGWFIYGSYLVRVKLETPKMTLGNCHRNTQLLIDPCGRQEIW